MVPSSAIAETFDDKATNWSRKRRWMEVIGDDRPLDGLLSSYIKDGMTIADIGGGDGGFLSHHVAKLPHCICFLLDLSRRMVMEAKTKLNAASSAVTLVANASRTPLPSGCCHIVVLRQVLHHTVNPSGVISEIWRILRPGGAVFVQVPGPGFFSTWSPYPGKHELDPVGRFSEDEISQILQQNGFTSSVWSQKFKARFENIYCIFKHAQAVGLLERLVQYRSGSSECFRELFEREPIVNLLTSGPPIEVEFGYVFGIGRKE
jgi:ubiquinone/menaquinone biosynthesis C-methylase UbiE